jgi:hypothetical protein
MLLWFLNQVKDKRSKWNQQYKLSHILLFTLFAIMSGCCSYREIESFIKIHYRKLNKIYKLKWKKCPSYWTIRYILIWVIPGSLEKAFRGYSEGVSWNKKGKHIALDGKTLKWSFDHIEDKTMLQVFSAFLTGKNIILAHEEIDWEKTNEIPVAQKLIKELWVKWVIFTGDAMHCQKKH